MATLKFRKQKNRSQNISLKKSRIVIPELLKYMSNSQVCHTRNLFSLILVLLDNKGLRMRT